MGQAEAISGVSQPSAPDEDDGETKLWWALIMLRGECFTCFAHVTPHPTVLVLAPPYMRRPRHREVICLQSPSEQEAMLRLSPSSVSPDPCSVAVIPKPL